MTKQEIKALKLKKGVSKISYSYTSQRGTVNESTGTMEGVFFNGFGVSKTKWDKEPRETLKSYLYSNMHQSDITWFCELDRIDSITVLNN